MRHILNIMGQRATTRNLQQAVLEALVGEILWIFRVHYTHTVDDEAVRIHVFRNGTKCHRPCTISLACHLLLACKLHVDLHLLGRLILVSKRYLAILMAGNRRS